MSLKPRRWHTLPLAVAAGAVAIAEYTARRASGSGKKANTEYTFTPWELGIPYETITFQTADGLTLRGWWLDRPESKRVVIGCAGHHGTKDELLGIGSGLWRAGNNVVLFDFRNRGHSDDAPMSLAYREQEDLLAAVAFAKARRSDANIGVVGYSMGAAVTLLAAARTPDIAAVVADSSFATMRDVIGDAYSQRKLPQRPLVDLADFLTRWRYGYPFNAVRPEDAIRKLAPRPVLLIHASGDRMIPLYHAERLFEAAQEPKELWIVPDWDHCGAYFADRPTYVERVARFFEEHLA